MTLLAHGCPVQAIVLQPSSSMSAPSPALAKRIRSAVQAGTRAPYRGRAGGAFAGPGRRAPHQGGRGAVYWLASALEVKSRLWLGGSISEHRDRELIRTLLIRVRACGPIEHILLVTDGLASYASQALHVFGKPLRTGKVGRPTLVLPATQ